MNLRDRVVVVTGGTAGVGYAAAQACASRGARVVVLSRDEDRVRRAAAALGAPARAFGRVVDMSDSQAVEAAAEEIEREVGPIDVWINNAMTTVFGRFADMTPEDFAKVTANTYLGTAYGTFAALKRMRARDRGVLIQVGSALAYQAIPLQSAYCGAKHGIRGFTNALREELRAEGSRVAVCMVQLSAFNTPQFDWARSLLRCRPQPFGTIFDPAVAGDAIARAAERPRREVWVGWPAVTAILASRIAPAITDRRAAEVAIAGQMQHVRASPQPGNLYGPVRRAPGAEGSFSAGERHVSFQWSASKNRGTLLGAVLLLATFGAGLYVRLGRRH